MTQQELENGTFMAAWAELADSNVQIVVPARNYDVREDQRILIPFIKGIKIGLLNKKGEEVVEPSYDVIRGDIYTESDFAYVGITYSYAFERRNKEPEVYTRQKWGLINAKGDKILEPEYSGITVGENTIIVRRAYGYNYDGGHALLSKNGETIIPFGRYWDIEPFENGLARCRNHKMQGDKRVELYGVINELGEVVLECKERHIMAFYGKYRAKVKELKETLREENPSALRKYFPASLEDITTAMEEIEKKRLMFEKNLERMASVISHEEELKISRDIFVEADLAGRVKSQISYGEITVVELKGGQTAVFKGSECVVPFGKYGWIDGFDNGLARVRSHGKTTYTKNIVATIDIENGTFVQDRELIDQNVRKEFEEHPELFAKWGIINERGEEVLPVIYDEVWNFYGKGWRTTKAVINGKERNISLDHLRRYFAEEIEEDRQEDDYGQHYGEYAGTYAQDVAGYSDDEINDAFDGEADAYWNID